MGVVPPTRAVCVPWAGSLSEASDEWGAPPGPSSSDVTRARGGAGPGGPGPNFGFVPCLCPWRGRGLGKVAALLCPWGLRLGKGCSRLLSALRGWGGVTAGPGGRRGGPRGCGLLPEPPHGCLRPPVSAARCSQALGPCHPALVLSMLPPPLIVRWPPPTQCAPAATSQGPACHGPSPPPAGSLHCGAAGVLPQLLEGVWRLTHLPPRARPLPVGFSGPVVWGQYRGWRLLPACGHAEPRPACGFAPVSLRRASPAERLGLAFPGSLRQRFLVRLHVWDPWPVQGPSWQRLDPAWEQRELGSGWSPSPGPAPFPVKPRLSGALGTGVPPRQPCYWRWVWASPPLP